MPGPRLLVHEGAHNPHGEASRMVPYSPLFSSPLFSCSSSLVLAIRLASACQSHKSWEEKECLEWRNKIRINPVLPAQPSTDALQEYPIGYRIDE